MYLFKSLLRLSLLVCILASASCSKEVKENENSLAKVKKVTPAYLITDHEIEDCESQPIHYQPFGSSCPLPGFPSVYCGKTFSVSINVGGLTSQNLSKFVCYYRNSGSNDNWQRCEGPTSTSPLTFSLTEAVGRPWNCNDAPYMYSFNDCVEFTLVYWPQLKDENGNYYTQFQDVSMTLSNLDPDGVPRWGGVYYNEIPGPGEVSNQIKAEVCCDFNTET